jgi:hypothetical protein
MKNQRFQSHNTTQQRKGTKGTQAPSTTTAMTELDGVPYFVLHLDDGNSKALFSVPSHKAASLMKYPIACRGAFFDLCVDTASRDLQSSQQQFAGTSFLSTEFHSPQPEETARAISIRLASRMADNDSVDMSGMLGLQRR